MSAENTEAITQALKNACKSIENGQDQPLELDQACVVFDICQALEVDPTEVLDQSTINLIAPGQSDNQLQLFELAVV